MRARVAAQWRYPVGMPAASNDVTALLHAWADGDPAALDQLTSVVYAELRRLAGAYMRKEQAGHTLQTTALVHEVYLRLLNVGQVDVRDRAHFFALAARSMRRILVDYARKSRSTKRGGAQGREYDIALNLDEFPSAEAERASALCALDDALEAFARLDPRRAKVVELRYFGGLSVKETAAILDVSPQTVMRDWKLAKAWLTRELS